MVGARAENAGKGLIFNHISQELWYKTMPPAREGGEMNKVIRAASGGNVTVVQAAFPAPLHHHHRRSVRPVS